MIASRTGLVACVSILCSAQLNAQVNINIDTTDVQQTMDGFGTSLRVFNDPHVIGGSTLDPITDGLVISTAEEDVILDLLYVDLGLTRVRPVTGGDGPIEDPNDNSDPYVTDTSAFDFSWKKTDAHIDYVERVVPRGVDGYFPAPILLEPWMTESQPEEYAEFAFTTIKRWQDRGAPLPLYSIINEPGYSFSGIWSGEFIRDCIKLLGPKLDSAGMTTRFVIPDDVTPNEAYIRSQVIMADSIARSYVAALAYHTYGGNNANKTAMKLLAQQYGIPVWMTEHYNADAFAWGNEMHDLIANYNISAVDALWAFVGDQGGGVGGALVALDHVGTTYTGYTLQKQYYVTGQYSRFVRSGAIRVGASSTSNDVRVTSYVDGTDMAIVVHNNHGVSQPVYVTTNGMSAGVLNGVRTSLTENWAVLPNTAVNSGMFTTVLPPNSITTFYTGQLSTAVEQLAAATPGMSVYPNPADQVIGLNLTSARSRDARITITDQRGRMVKEEVARIGGGTAQVTIALPELANGVYVISAEVDGTILKNRLIIAR